MRRFFLVSYDVADDRRRTRISKLLEGWGDRVQYSVFCCQLNPRERHALMEALKERLHAREDQVILVDAGAVEGEYPAPDMAYLGKVWKPEPRARIV